MLPYLSMFVLVSFTAGGTLRAPSVSLNAGQGIHGPRSIDQELDHLTRKLEITPNQRKQIRPLLEEHHNKIHGGDL
jgi:hypothetical protein